MKQLSTIILFAICLLSNLQAQVKIGGTGSPHPNSVLELDGGTNKGLLLPKHTHAEMIEMTNAPDGMIIYNTTIGKICIRRLGIWEIAGGISLPHVNSYAVDNNYILKLTNSSGLGHGAIMGISQDGKGLTGSSDSGMGIYAHAQSGIALHASSESGPAFTTGIGNVGIGTSYPSAPLHVLKQNSLLLQLENSSTLAAGIRSDMFLKTGNYFTGSVATIGSNATTARMGFLTGAHTAYTSLIERMSITNDGNIGINNISPSAKLDVVGTSEFNAGLISEKAINVNGEAVFNQTAGAAAAVNINGRIKTSGTNPRAFIVTAGVSDFYDIMLDHPDLNNNPNAIILVTPRNLNTPTFKGNLYVRYEPLTGKWSVSTSGITFDELYIDIDFQRCDGFCIEDRDVATSDLSRFDVGQQFNVLVIGN